MSAVPASTAASSPAATPVAPLPAEAGFRERRLQQLLLVLVAAISVSLLPKLLTAELRAYHVMMMGAVALLCGALWLLRRGAVDTAAAIMLGTVTAMLLTLMTLNSGLRDTSVVALPGMLVIAALLGTPRQYLLLFGLVVAAAGALGLANVHGWHVNRIAPVRGSTVVDLVTILIVTGFSIGLLARDLATTLTRLRSENDEVRRSRDRIEFMAGHDALTGLPNRLLARDRFEQAAAAARRAGRKVALLYLDLDHFRTVNDSLGHPAGDELLRRLGERLRGLLRASDTVSRTGGDEFLILLGGIADGDAAAEAGHKLLAQAAAPLALDGVELHPSASLGIALFPDDGDGFDALLKKADIAMYRAKDAGRNTLRFFDAAMNDSVADHLQLVAGMRRALEQGEFVLHYQPQLCLASGRVLGAEALLRWQHPEHGLVPPGRFIPLAERSGQIVEIGAWVLKEACRQAAAWQRAGLPPLMMSVNLSPLQVRRGALERDVLHALQASGLDPRRLELELTESLLIEDSEALRATLARLRALGITFAIDDFGTGYSNLAYLKRFEVERLKIDQSFVRRLVDNAEDEAIVRAIVQMAGALRLGVIAEGIEDAATLERLRGIGCAQGQGYHWAPALPAERFEAFVRGLDAG
ncbi:MAG: EAL domain-containing protein [Rubrivivax sp.]|nr:EAL domain-containing protein [Rubrivivax sp.]